MNAALLHFFFTWLACFLRSIQVMQCDISGCACETVSGLKTPFRSQDFVCVEDERTGLAS